MERADDVTENDDRRQSRHRVVIVGGGFGGVQAAKALRHADVDVTVVDRTNHHLFQPLLYQVATGILSPGLIAPALRRVLKKQRNARTLLAEVGDIDLENKIVHASAPDGQHVALPYDTLIVAGGATHAYFGHPEWAEHAPGMKTIEDARLLRSRILGAYELAEVATDPAEQRAYMTFVVVGAGPTGVEVAGQLSELAHHVLPKEYRTIDTRQARIILLDGAPAVLPPFAARLQRYTKRTLEKKGVEIRLDTMATDMDADSITVKGPQGEERIVARTKVWAAGVQASPLAETLAKATGTEVDGAGRLAVDPDCSLPGRRDVYAIGDMVSTIDHLPGVAQVAMQQGTYVGKLVAARAAGDDTTPAPFRYFDKGSMATIGAREAVADVRGLKFTGILGYLLWCYVHVMFLIGWGNRLGTLFNWVRSLRYARFRGHRLISVTASYDEDVTDEHHNLHEPAEHRSHVDPRARPADGRDRPSQQERSAAS
ncbi:NADH dehydrogenase [Pseudonocardia endophytica]|uniref:NADH:ubiquinone reductase (non-electrogenic) n=2 Tax=Pseudonocardia endophytica TaxID=401976 RepID=A0A4R1I7A7_PSEEN|nr:NADH dehydrogenase [Pseudonocardia endophytica]